MKKLKFLTGGDFNKNWKSDLTEELKALKESNPEEFSKLKPQLYKQNNVNYAKAWYAERAKLDKYKPLLAGNMSYINHLLDLSVSSHIPWNDVVSRLGGRPVDAGRPVLGGFTTDKQGNTVWFGERPNTLWHEGIGHWIGDLMPSILNAAPKEYFKYSGPLGDDAYLLYLDKKNEKHANTWEFRGMNKDMKDNNGNLYIDPNRLLTGEDVQEMIDKGARIPSHWLDTTITPDLIANFHNTFASNNTKVLNKTTFGLDTRTYGLV